MNIKDLNTIEQLEQFLTGSQSLAFLVASSPRRFDYAMLIRPTCY
ncbi:MAG: hypothetical protein ABL925_17865 [Methylococcales bacterium]